jgi:RND family efflux transporter MFP subunit
MLNLRRVAIIIIVVVVVLAAGIIIYKQLNYNAELENRKVAVQAGQYVQTARAKMGAANRSLSLIAEAKPYTEVTLYAKVSGYLHEISVDKGDKVKKGQVLARIESPETDKDYAGAAADAQNKRAIAERMKALKDKNLVSKQDAEQADTEARVSESHKDATGAQKNYEIVRAPFDGTVTARFADPGALLQAATGSQSGSMPIVRLSQIDRLRIYAYVDQKDASYIRLGDPAQIVVKENPGQPINATVSRLANQLDSNTRTLLTEIDIDNTKQAIIPGSFVTVELKAHMPAMVEVPSEAIVLQKKSQVAVIENNTLNYRDVVIYNNNGVTAQILSGLKAGEIVGVGINSTLLDKSKVQPISPRD